MPVTPSVRAQIVERRTYLRPTNAEGTEFETPYEAVDRQIEHQRWLWERAKAGFIRDNFGEWVLEPLDMIQELELSELRDLMRDRKVTLSGRTRWLGGTNVSKKREASQFNCSFIEVRNVHDVVDILWLLLQGCGVGFRPITGTLNGFSRTIPEVRIRRSTRIASGGRENNIESYDPKTGHWIISVGDSAESWAKSIGKLLSGKHAAKKLTIDFTQIRPAGERLKGYGWISSGDEQISKAYEAIAAILNKRAGQLLTRIDILDVVNWLGTILSSRRSAQIALMAVGEPEWEEFAAAKVDHFAQNPQRSQSNNSIMFNEKPTRRQLTKIFKSMIKAGGSEPGFINAQAAEKRAPWFKGVNPCAEIMLGDRSFCNLVETVLFRFNGDEEGLHRAHYLIARANYRQTCVWLDDGVLQRGWHELNEFLRLCGVGVTGVVSWEYSNDADAWMDLRISATTGADDMADELGTARAKAVTTIKPSGTQSKTLSLEGQECSEGIHKPLGRYIFNNVGFSKYDPILDTLDIAGYHIFPNPYDDTGVLVRIPVEFSNISFDEVNGVELNIEKAIDQLDRYKIAMDNYVDHNCSITVSYDESEAPDIINWVLENWDSYVGVSFLFRTDPTKKAEDLGYPYLPQEVVDEFTFRAYEKQLKPLDLGTEKSGDMEIDIGAECVSGACPIR